MNVRFERDLVSRVLKRLQNPPVLIQIITGLRQVWKTTAARQIAEKWPGPVHFSAADTPLPPVAEWIESQWSVARTKGSAESPCLLVLDEVQKVSGWSNVVKMMFDQERASSARRNANGPSP
jgi:predicted AAA+ superfamily ATPase